MIEFVYLNAAYMHATHFIILQYFQILIAFVNKIKHYLRFDWLKQ